jgi:hypothetical protein
MLPHDYTVAHDHRAAGDYQLRLCRPGYDLAEERITIGSNVVAPLVRVRRAEGVRLSVGFAGGESVKNVAVSVRSEQGRAFRLLLRLDRYRIGRLPPALAGRTFEVDAQGSALCRGEMERPATRDRAEAPSAAQVMVDRATRGGCDASRSPQGPPSCVECSSVQACTDRVGDPISHAISHGREECDADRQEHVGAETPISRGALS